ncbi:MAG: hypothetical protein K2K81_00290 [Muribaculaceae bacterium]|nr:hypothetical protein [Muribaculaceae bacterium]
MKKLFTILAGASMLFSGLAAEKPTNDAFYIVGNMNGWSTPTDDELPGWEYKLTDEDGDGVFTGSFELTEAPIFKLFSGAGGWNDAVYFGYDSSIVLLKEPKTITLLPGYGSTNIEIMNWVPGVFTLSAEWVQREDESWFPKLTMSGSNQPEKLEKPTNTAFYLVGEMTGWEMPTAANAADWKYKLTDEDGDGVFTGSFELTKAQNQFAIFSEPDANWGDSSIFGNGAPHYLFSSEDYSFDLFSNSTTITLANWEGGILNMSIVWEENANLDFWAPKATLNAPNQPKKPEVPEVYVIGDFNNWQYPTANALNGAVRLTESTEYPTGYIINEIRDWDAVSQSKFAFCKKDKDSGNFLVFNGKNNVPFTLYSFKKENGKTFPNYITNGEFIATSSPADYSFTLKDWQGGKIDFYFESLFSGEEFIGMGGEDTKIMPDPAPLYIIAEYNGTKEKYPAEWFNVENYYNFNVWARGENVSIIISTEDSLTPDPANCYGIETALSEAGLNYNNRNQLFSLVKGGKPFSMDFYPYSGTLTAYINYPTSTVNVRLDYYGGPIVADHVYVCGDVSTGPDGEYNNFLAPSSANQEVYDQYWSLKDEGNGIFTGLYYIPIKVLDPEYSYDLPQFRFFTELLGWTSEASLGSAEDDFFCLPADLDEGPKTFTIVHPGLGNWGANLPTSDKPFNWEANWVKMTVDCNANKVTFELIPAGVEEIGSETDAIESWYNLQGIKIEKPEKGLYIHIVNGKSKVQYVR